jgi:signal transduction histidine kinase
MLSSLRARLWLSYTLLIVAILSVIGGVLFLALRPLLYRQSVLRLETIQGAISTRLETVLRQSPERLVDFVQREAAARQVRIAVLNQDGKISADSDAAEPIPNRMLQRMIQNKGTDSFLVATFRDAKGKTWLYTLHDLAAPYMLVTAIPRPALRLAAVVRDELIAPILRIGAVGLLLAFLLSFWMANWVTRPIQRMEGSVRAVAKGEYPALTLEGPTEVQALLKAFNEMGQKVQTSQQSQRDFVANVSHELKTPITSIQGFAQAILDGTVQTPEALHQAAAVIYSESNRMARLVMDLLTLARLEGGTADLQNSPVDLNALLKNGIDKLSLQAGQAQVTFFQDLKPIPVIHGDGDRLAQVFTNLVENAIKYTQAGGKVTIATQSQAGMVEIRVADTGMGIAPEDQKRIFERFYQVDRSRQGGAGHGVGLGLSIARQIVLAHRGEIEVESVIGQGSTFVVKLPLVPRVPESQ